MGTEEKPKSQSFLDKINYKKLAMILAIIVVCANVFFVAVATIYLWYNTSSHYVKVATYTASKIWEKYTDAYDDRLGNINGRDVVQRQKEAMRAFDLDFKKDYGLSILTKAEQKPVVVVTNVVDVPAPVQYRKKYVAPVQTEQSSSVAPQKESKNSVTNDDRVALENEFKSLDMRFPLEHKYMHQINSAYGVREKVLNPNTGGGGQGGSTFHLGVDYGCPEGTPIYAPADGIVASQKFDPGYGTFIVLKHGNGDCTRYAHLLKPMVAFGQTVKKGQLIAYSGGRVGPESGFSTGEHLHFELFKIINGEEVHVDPMNVLYD